MENQTEKTQAGPLRSGDLFGSFVCKRASSWEGKPCDEAHEMELNRVDRRTVDDPMKNPYIGAAWYDSGKNHRVDRGHICRDHKCDAWVVNIDGPVAFEAFARKYGQLVVEMSDDYNPPMWVVEIYDDYRE